MILEVAILDVKPSMVNEFETAFKIASTIIASMPGYISHELQRCIETTRVRLLPFHSLTEKPRSACGFFRSGYHVAKKEVIADLKLSSN
jgi:hypothetical protein